MKKTGEMRGTAGWRIANELLFMLECDMATYGVKLEAGGRQRFHMKGGSSDVFNTAG